MGYARVAPLALFLLATSIMFSTKNIEAAHCVGACSMLDEAPCGSSDCSCYPTVGPFLGLCKGLFGPTQLSSSVAKMIDEHPNLCQSHEECMKKGSGNFCAPYPKHYMDYGWCVNSDSEELKSFLAMPRAISK
ncbi:albumin-1-like [Phaseolus vulgaris]|uniref:albumin-1-like n=1 Tax=Phaseolus vulgaris TaxID=3885 RepID=UPI0035C9834B